MQHDVDILHVVPAYFPARGGIEVLVENLCPDLSRRHDITSAVLTAAAPRDWPIEYDHCGTKVYSVSRDIFDRIAHHEGAVGDGKTQLSAIGDIFSGIRAIVERVNPRIVHMHYSTNVTAAVLKATRALGIPVVFHVHGTIHEGNRDFYRRILSDSPWVCAVSDAVADSIRFECGRTGPIRVIRNGVVDSTPAPEPFDPFTPSVAMIGRLGEEKGFDDGLRALDVVRGRYPDLRIRIVGAGPMEPSLFALARQLDLLDAIEFFGELPNDRARRVLAGVDVVIVPSKEVEGFSITAVEAALLERPVVATSVGGLPETVIDGLTGLMVPPQNPTAISQAVVRLLDDDDLRRTIGSQARHRALATFGQDRFVDEIADLYATVLGDRAPVSPRVDEH